MNRVAFAISAGAMGPPLIIAHAIEGSEGVSRLYRFDVEVATRAPGPLFERYVLGQAATIAMRVSEHTRTIHGIVMGVRALDATDEALHLGRYSLRVAPSAWLMKKRRGSRIFQDQSIPSILRAVVEPLGLRLRIELDRELPERPYTTQFEETDYEFFRRLCAENALLFYFEQPSDPLEPALLAGLDRVAAEEAAIGADLMELLRSGGGTGGVRETIVLTDRAGYPPIAGLPAVRYRSAGALVGSEESIATFTVRERVASSRAVYREYDPGRPLSPLEADHSVVRHGLEADEDERLELYHHEGRDLHPNWEYGQLEPERVLAQSRRKKRLGSGTSNVVRLEAGHTFVLEEHPLDVLHHGWVVTSVRHSGSSSFGDVGSTAYDNRFECLPAHVPFVPARRRRALLQSTMTALVVGPDGEEIHVDEHGRIKVKFHWDRGDELHDPTCWIRVLQAWSGTVWGTQFIPRIGMEAVVTFENGDPDKPLIIGCVYNRVQPLPFKLPEDKTRSGFRTQSSPHSGGFNELSFEDRANEEQVYLRAQRDFDSTTGRNRSAHVSADDATSVGHDHSLSVGHDQNTTVENDRTVRVQGDDQVRVHGARDVHVTQGLHEQAASYRADIAGVSHHQVGRRLKLEAPIAQLDGTVRAGVFGETALNLDSFGRTSLSGRNVAIAGDEVMLQAESAAFIRITDDTIQLYAKKIRLNGEDAQLVMEQGKARFKVTNKFQVVSDQSIVLKAQQASVGLQSEARIDGSQILLNSPTQASDTISVDVPATSTIVLFDQDGEPQAGVRVLITNADGSTMIGLTNDHGVLNTEVDGSATITYPELSDTQDE